MCKPPKPKAVAEKPIQYLRNPFLDGLSITRSQSREALRRDMGTGAAYVNPYDTTPGAVPGKPVDPMGPVKPASGLGLGGLLIKAKTIGAQV